MLQTSHFSAISSAVVDVDKGVITGVSVITEGVAKGHGRLIDSITLGQVLKVALTHNGGIKVKLNHEKETRLENTCGTLRDFRLDGKQLRADLHLLKSDNNYGKILELAQHVPEDFGLSLVIRGLDDKSGSTPIIRCEEILSADLVDAPAGNPTGLFSQTTQIMTDTTQLESELKALKAELETVKTQKLSVPQDITDKLVKLTEMETTLTKLAEGQASAIKLAEKAQKDSLVAQAARDGKKIPLSDEEISELSVKTLESMITKLDKNVVSTSTKTKFTIPDKADERKTALEAKRAEGALALTAHFASQGFAV